ncbi:MAG TPA: GntR family transcriptional regulator [Candidatus Limnocylindrales bacterium]|nr:GntR family transcriptional regulator [Candidatus Limnocylindrales bacterium]
MARTPREASEYDADQLGDIVARARGRYRETDDAIVPALREAILDGILPPGARLRQEDLAAVFQTSRIPIRAALRALEYEGLATSEPHRGYTVTSLDGSDIEEIYELRILLESHAVRLAIPLLTEEDLEELEAAYQAMATATDADEQLARRDEFYARLYAVTARPRLVDSIVRLRREVARPLRWKLATHTPSHHETFWHAIRDADADAACRELATHYRRVSALLRRLLRADGGLVRPAATTTLSSPMPRLPAGTATTEPAAAAKPRTAAAKPPTPPA